MGDDYIFALQARQAGRHVYATGQSTLQVFREEILQRSYAIGRKIWPSKFETTLFQKRHTHYTRDVYLNY